MNQSKNRKTVLMICMVGMMAALVAVGSNVPNIKIPSPLGTNRFHLGNVMCALSGLLLGPWWGGLASGLGSSLYDLLMDPTRITDTPITFITKGLYGVVAGAVYFKVFKGKSNYWSELAASTAAAVTYIAVYLGKSFFYNGLLLQGLSADAAWLAVLGRVPSSLFNGIVAVIFAPILGVALHKALKAAHLDGVTAGTPGASS